MAPPVLPHRIHLYKECTQISPYAILLLGFACLTEPIALRNVVDYKMTNMRHFLLKGLPKQVE